MIRTLNTYLIKNVGILGCFLKPKGACERKKKKTGKQCITLFNPYRTNVENRVSS